MKTEVAEKNVETQQAYPKGRWTLNANPFNTTRRVPAAPVQSGPVTAQGELSLDRVRPVRNDLSDSDLELIPSRQVQENVFAAPTVAPETVKKQTFWARLRARFRRNPAK